MKRVWLAQVNNKYGDQAFLPYSVGLLQAYAQTLPEIKDSYQFSGFIYLREDIEQAVQRMGPVDVLGVSAYIWNFRYSMALAKAVKEANPNCLIVLGGPHVPTRSEGFFQKYLWADVLVHYEGEHAFSEVLMENLKLKDFTGIPGLTVNVRGNSVPTARRERLADLDSIPSPYLEGVFDSILDDPVEYHPTQEVDRGCPYSCTFCDWGSSVFTKVRRFSDQRLFSELEWFSRKRMSLVYNASANYGIVEKDVLLTERMAQLKRETGFPQKFRAAFAKNSGDRVYRINKILNDAGMSKGATLSFQSMDQGTLVAIKRKNIGTEVFSNLMKQYRKEGIPTYSELIVGLPGETYDSFADGLDTLVNCGQHDSLSIYTCEVLPNSEMSAPEYREKYGIKTAKVPVLFFHGTPSVDPHSEEYELVVGTNTLSQEDWLKCEMLGWAFQCFHCLGLTQKIAVFCKHYAGIPYRSFYEGLLRHAEKNPGILLGTVAKEIKELFAGIPQGKGWGVIDQRFGNIIWPPEEGAFLKYVSRMHEFYEDIAIYCDFLVGSICRDLLWYQRGVLKTPFGLPYLQFTHDVHGYLEGCYTGEASVLSLKEGDVWYQVEDLGPPCQFLDLETYAREVVWFGRKGGSMFRKVKRIQPKEEEYGSQTAGETGPGANH